MFAPKRILVPTDFSTPSDLALKQAIEIASQNKSKIFLLHVIDKVIRQCAVDYCLDYSAVKKLEEDSEKAAKDMLEKEVKKVLQNQKIEIEYDIQRGTPADVILKEQKNKDIDLTVIASHGKTGLKKVLMGSVAEKVLKGTKSPALLVK
jgi:nucleotide-binding universal stress UspA family protein